MKTASLLRVLTIAVVAAGAGQSCSSKDDKAQEEAVAPDTEQDAEAAEGQEAGEGEESAEEGADAAEEGAEATEEGAEATEEGADAMETETADAEYSDMSNEAADAADVMADSAEVGEAVDTGGEIMAGEAFATDEMAPTMTETEPMVDSSQVMDNGPTTVIMEPTTMSEEEYAATTGAASAQAPMAAPAPVAAPAASADGATVKYVQSQSLKVYSSADVSSSVMRTLWKGDHMLVSVEGSWGRLSSGGYVQLSGLSDRGVGRPRGAGSWQ